MFFCTVILWQTIIVLIAIVPLNLTITLQTVFRLPVILVFFGVQ